MDMKRINAGKLRAIGYDAGERLLRVELADGTAIDYSGVGQEIWRHLSTASSSTAWSFYRDNIEEEFHGKRGRVSATAATTATASPGRAALDALFQAPSTHDDET